MIMPLPTTRRALRMLVAPFAVVAQLLVVALPLAEAAIERARGQNAGAHIEETGARTHYAHSEAGCAACAAQQSNACGEAAATLAPAIRRAPFPASSVDQRSAALVLSTHAPRAPPVVS